MFLEFGIIRKEASKIGTNRTLCSNAESRGSIVPGQKTFLGISKTRRFHLTARTVYNDSWTCIIRWRTYDRYHRWIQSFPFAAILGNDTIHRRYRIWVRSMLQRSLGFNHDERGVHSAASCRWCQCSRIQTATRYQLSGDRHGFGKRKVRCHSWCLLRRIHDEWDSDWKVRTSFMRMWIFVLKYRVFGLA